MNIDLNNGVNHGDSRNVSSVENHGENNRTNHGSNANSTHSGPTDQVTVKIDGHGASGDGIHTLAVDTGSERPKQLRGENLIQRIREVVQAQGKAAQDEGKPFILRKAAIAKEVPCTRKTLDTYKDEINAIVLSLFPTARYNQDGSIELERLRARLKATEERADKLDQENRQLMATHAKIFDALVMAGVHPSVLQGINLPGNVVAFPPSKTP